jgi:hypothetical protein
VCQKFLISKIARQNVVSQKMQKKISEIKIIFTINKMIQSTYENQKFPPLSMRINEQIIIPENSQTKTIYISIFGGSAPFSILMYCFRMFSSSDNSNASTQPLK